MNHSSGTDEMAPDPGENTITAAVVESFTGDPVFSVKKSLVREFRLVDDPGAAQHGLTPPYRHADIELVLEPA